MIQVTFSIPADFADCFMIHLSDGWSKLVPNEQFLSCFRFYCWSPKHIVVCSNAFLKDDRIFNQLDFSSRSPLGFDNPTKSPLGNEVFELLEVQQFKSNFINE